MKIPRNSLFIKYVYMWQECDIPDQTNVCNLFWRAFIGMPILYVLSAAIAVMVSPFFLLLWLCNKVGLDLSKSIHLPPMLAVACQRVTDWRERVCTTVEIEP